MFELVIPHNHLDTVGSALEGGAGPKPGIHRLLDSLAFHLTCQRDRGQGNWSTMGEPQQSFCRHLQQPEKKILQQLRSRGDDLFVVTEVLQTKEEVQITEIHSQEGSGQFTLPGALCLQVCGCLALLGRVVMAGSGERHY